MVGFNEALKDDDLRRIFSFFKIPRAQDRPRVSKRWNRILWEKKPGVVRIWVDGCFDMMHYGHANLLRQSRLLGDELYVGIHTDEEVFKFKGGYPVMSAAERYAACRACKWVTRVIEDAPYVTEMTDLRKFDVDFVSHGDDLSVDLNGNDSYAAVKEAGMMKYVRRTEGISTTDLVGRMLLLTKSHHEVESEGGSALKSLTGSFSESQGQPQELSKFLTTSRRIIQFSNNRAPKDSDIIVYVDGDFDLFHEGHCAFLREARKQGTYLIVGVHTDKVVNQRKGANYPIMNLNERVLSVLSCRYTDECILGVPFEVSAELLKTMNVKLVCAGAASTRMAYESDPYAVPKQMGIFREVVSGSDMTAEKMINRVIRHRLDYEERNRKKNAKDAVLQSQGIVGQDL